jgi:hypothetical protein
MILFPLPFKAEVIMTGTKKAKIAAQIGKRG